MTVFDPSGQGRDGGHQVSSISLCEEGGVWAVMTVPSSNVLGRAVHMYSWSLGRGCSYISNTSAIW